MKKILVFSTLLVLSGFSVQAVQNNTGTQNGSGAGAGNTVSQQSQQQLMISFTPTGNQVKNLNQIQTQNQGEEQQLQIQTQEQKQIGASQGGSINTQNRSQNAEEHMSVVAEKVQELQQIQEEGGLGEQVKQIAQEQSVAQEQIKQNINKLNSRGALKKILFGTDYTAIKNLKNQLVEDQLRITELEQLKLQLINQEDIVMVQSTIEALIQQNTILQEQINKEEGAKSMFGWLMSFFSK